MHPSLFTDEAFMVLSDASRMLLIGLWTEADDQGVFEWKPLTLKARLRPANDGSVEPLLQEISDQNLIKKIEVDGKGYGLVRNFRKFQRPQKPNAVHPLPDEYRTYVGLVSDQSRTATGKSPQMEDVGGKMDDERGEREEAARLQFERFFAEYPDSPNNPKSKAVEQWMALGLSEEESEMVVFAAGAYRRWLQLPEQKGCPICHAHNWLRERRWEGFSQKSGGGPDPEHARIIKLEADARARREGHERILVNG